MMKIDAAILMGDRGKVRLVGGVNKNFLEINGLPLFFYVLQSLEEARQVNRILVVGDRDRILRIMDRHGNRLKSMERITVLDQGRSLFENAFLAFYKALDLDETGGSDPDQNREEKTMFYLPGDVPLITAREIDDFLEKCDLTQFDYLLGVSTEEYLRPFYPLGKQRGIQMAYFYLKEKKCRQNNLHVTKPLTIKNRHYIQKIYDYRYQKEFLNFFRLLCNFRQANVQVRGVYYFLVLHLNLLMSRLGLESLTPVFRQLITRKKIEELVGEFLGCRFRIIESQSAGATLDIDNERDYETMKVMFDQWREYQIAHEQRRPLPSMAGETA